MEFQYINLSHEYKIISPKTAEAMDRLYLNDIYDERGEIDSCFESMTFFEDLYYPLETILFDPINIKCDSLINMYEEVVIENEDLDKVQEVVDCLKGKALESNVQELVLRFIQLLECSESNGTGLGFYY